MHLRIAALGGNGNWDHLHDGTRGTSEDDIHDRWLSSTAFAQLPVDYASLLVLSLEIVTMVF